MRPATRVGLSFDALLVVVLFTVVAAGALLVPAQGDTFWHLRAGQDFWRTGVVPMIETYSHSHAGRAWPNHAWLWQALCYAAYSVGAFPLLNALCAAIITAAYALVFRLTQGSARIRFAVLGITLPLGTQVWAVRPQIASLLMLALVLWLLVNARFVFLPPAFALWANLHGAVALGVATVGAAVMVALAFDRGKLRRLLPVLPLCALATLLTPMGLGLWSFIRESIGRSQDIQIQEWQPVRLASFEGVFMLLVVLGLLVLLALRWRRLRTWGDLVLVGASLVLLVLAIRHGRNVPPFLFAAAPLASRLLAEPAPAATRPDTDHPRVNLAIAVSLALILFATVGFVWHRRLPFLGWQRVRPDAIAALRACPGKLYNTFNNGGEVIWFVPEKPVYVDNRQDPYPHAFVAASIRNEIAGVEPQALLAAGMPCAYLHPDSPTGRKLRTAGWRQTFADERAIVWQAP